jgi:hypothetical protein
MRILYSLALTLVLISAALLVYPPKITSAATCSAHCDTGEVISIRESSWCSCIDNIGCVWRRDGKAHAKKFSGTELCITAVAWEDR